MIDLSSDTPEISMVEDGSSVGWNRADLFHFVLSMFIPAILQGGQNGIHGPLPIVFSQQPCDEG